jgi:hypothetical protein
LRLVRQFEMGSDPNSPGTGPRMRPTPRVQPISAAPVPTRLGQAEPAGSAGGGLRRRPARNCYSSHPKMAEEKLVRAARKPPPASSSRMFKHFPPVASTRPEHFHRPRATFRSPAYLEQSAPQLNAFLLSLSAPRRSRSSPP